MHRDLIVVANETRACLYERIPGNQALADCGHVVCEAGDVDPHGGILSHVSFGKLTEGPHRARSRFAGRLAEELHVRIDQGWCRQLHVFAPEPFLSDLRHHLRPATARVLHGAVDVDLTAYDRPELEVRVDIALHLVEPSA